MRWAPLLLLCSLGIAEELPDVAGLAAAPAGRSCTAATRSRTA
ncbi:MAG: hypothetical protein ACYTGV_09590 [Planctomycetota bacterium]